MSPIETITPQAPHERINVTVPSTVLSRSSIQGSGGSHHARAPLASSKNSAATTQILIKRNRDTAEFLVTDYDLRVQESSIKNCRLLQVVLDQGINNRAPGSSATLRAFRNQALQRFLNSRQVVHFFLDHCELLLGKRFRLCAVFAI